MPRTVRAPPVFARAAITRNQASAHYGIRPSGSMRCSYMETIGKLLLPDATRSSRDNHPHDHGQAPPNQDGPTQTSNFFRSVHTQLLKHRYSRGNAETDFCRILPPRMHTGLPRYRQHMPGTHRQLCIASNTNTCPVPPIRTRTSLSGCPHAHMPSTQRWICDARDRV